MKTVLLATDCKFWLEDRGSTQRISNLYRHLQSQEFHVVVFLVGQLKRNDLKSLQNSYDKIEIVTLQHGSITIGKAVPAKYVRIPSFWYTLFKQKIKHIWSNRILPIARSLLSDRLNSTQSDREEENLNVSNFFQQDYQDLFRAVCRELEPDFIIVEYIRLAYLIEEIQQATATNPLTLIDTHDVKHQRYQKYREHGESEIYVTQEEEKRLLAQFDVILAIQSQDGETFRKMLPNHQTIVVGYAPEFTPHPFRDTTTINIAYVAGKNSANKQAIAFFLETVYPQLQKISNRQISLNVVGKICEQLTDVSLPNNVNLIGWIDDLKTVYRDADIAINPVYFGSGLKIKTVEALCHGKPLVTTTVGAEGLEHGKGNAFFVCDRPEDTIQQLSALIENPHLRKDIARQAFKFAQENFTEGKVYQELDWILTSRCHSSLKGLRSS